MRAKKENAGGRGTAGSRRVSEWLDWAVLVIQLMLSIPILGVLKVTEWLWENSRPSS